KMGLRPFLEPVDVVVSSHEHLDHNYVDPAFGTPDIVKSAARVRGVQFRGVRLPHDDEEGMRRGWVTASIASRQRRPTSSAPRCACSPFPAGC
ncbi:MAG: MBL fold metallo-hydrolase, partial [Candidatus Solibacter sp.]|nr:MBL fold metallo-hydrolase [Candidatus Solibacter sp.]